MKPSPRRPVGLFGGSFDPPHYGHIHLILSLKEHHGLEQVVVVPAFSNPLKSAVASPQQRLHMAHLAFDPIPDCVVVDYEYRLPPPSFTINTVREILATMPSMQQRSVFLLLGSDILTDVHRWKDVDDLFAITHPLIAARGHVSCHPSLSEKTRSLIRAGWTDTGIFDISSTAIRDRVARHLYVNHLMPEAVVHYIQEQRLYA
jgi:nicotinate-nucleotide adenylyltransferase